LNLTAEATRVRVKI